MAISGLLKIGFGEIGQITEESSALIPVGFTNSAGEPAAPAQIFWSLLDDSGKVINDKQAKEIESPLPSVNILLFGPDLSLTTEGKVRNLTIKAVFFSDLAPGAAIPATAGLRFEIASLPGIPMETPEPTAPAAEAGDLSSGANSLDSGADTLNSGG